MRFRLIALAAVVVLGGGVPAPAAEETSHRELHLDIELTDGTRVLGRTLGLELTLATSFGKVELTLAGGDRVEANGDQETVTLRTRNGDVIRGAVCATRHPEVFRMNAGSPLKGHDRGSGIRILVRPYRDSETREIPFDRVRSLRAMDPIRIAGSGDADWEIAYENASGWTPLNIAGALTVTDIDSDTENPGSGGRWGTVRLRRPVERPGDFHLFAEISWDDKGAGLRVMQNLFVSVVDRDGGMVAAVGHNDAWSGETGSRYSQLPGIARWHSSSYNTQPTCGRAKIEIVRTGDKLEVRWDGRTKHRGKSRACVKGVEVQFDFYDYRKAGQRSTFGSVTLHRLELR